MEWVCYPQRTSMVRRFQTAIDLIKATWSWSGEPVYVDMGSRFTKYMVGDGMPFQQASCVAGHQASGALVSWGDKAAQLVGKNPKTIKVVWPIRRGVFTDGTWAQWFVNGWWAAVNQKMSVKRVMVHVALPAYASPMDKALLTTVFKTAGLHRIELVSSAQALLKTAMTVGKNSSGIIVSIGAEVTEIIVYSNSEIKTYKSFYYGTHNLTEKVKNHLQLEHHFVVGWQTAEELVKTVVKCRLPDQKRNTFEPIKVTVRGKDTLSNAPVTVSVSAEMCEGVTKDWEKMLITDLHHVMKKMPEDVYNSVLNNGVWLTGGGSTVAGLKEAMIQSLGVPVTLASEPAMSVVQGVRLCSTKI